MASFSKIHKSDKVAEWNKPMLNVLLIEDDELYASLVKMVLERTGFNVTVATTGHEGLDLLEQQHYDVLILDVALPRMNGIEILQRIREMPSLAHLPIIMATADGSIKVRQEAERIGVNGFFEKPFDFDELMALMHQLVQT